MDYNLIEYIVYLIIGILFYIFVFEKYYSDYKGFSPCRLCLYSMGALLFLPSALLIELVRTFKKIK